MLTIKYFESKYDSMKAIQFTSRAFLFLIIAISNINAQIAYFNYVPLEFIGAEPLWIHVTCDSTMIGAETIENTATYDGHSHVHGSFETEDDYIIHEGYLYKVSSTVYQNDFSGAIIEKIDIKTGELIWKTIFDGRTSDYREHVERTIIEDNRLLLYNYMITQPDPEEFTVPIVFLGWAEGILKIREYDLETGALISETTPDINNPESKLIRDYNFDVAQLHVLSDENLLLYKRYFDTTASFFVIDTLDHMGLVLNEPDTVWSELVIGDWGDSYWNRGYGIRRDSEGLTYWLDYYVPGNFTLDSAQANINIYKEKELIDILPLGFIEKSNIRTWYLRDVTEDYIYLHVQYFDNGGSSHIFLDKGGQLIKEIYNPLQMDQFIKLDKDNNFIVSGRDYKVGDNYEFSFFQSDQSSLSKVSSMMLNIPDYGIEITQIQKLQDNDYLVAGVYYKLEDFRSRGTARFIMKLSEEMILGQTVSINNLNGIITDVTIYPNPASNILSIKFEELSHFDVTIFDMQGKLYHKESFHAQAADIDVSYLQDGIYTVIISLNGQILNKKFIKI